MLNFNFKEMKTSTSFLFALQEEKQEPMCSRLETLFMGVEHQINFFSDGKRMVADVVYTDFLPVITIKEVVRKMLPESFHLSIHREYSPKVIATFLYEEFCRNNIAIIDCINGSLEAQPIRQFVNDRLDMYTADINVQENKQKIKSN